MKKIQSVEITNFKCHRNLKIDFSDYTTIVGPTDTGKSTVLKAIYWCLLNNPSGDSFITHDENYCEVSCILNDGSKITRKRSKNTSPAINCYDILMSNGQSLHLENFGVGPVEEVTAIHGIREIDIFGKKQFINICTQFSNPFFLSETPNTKAVMIGKLGKTDVIDLSIKNTSSDIRNKKSEKKEYNEQLKEINTKLKELTGLDSMEKAIIYAEKRIEDMEYLNSKITNIKSVSEKIKDGEKTLESLKNNLCDEGEVNGAIELISEAEILLNKLSSIKKISQSLKEYQEKYKSLKETVSNINIDELNEVINNVDEIIKLSKDISSIKSTFFKIKELELKKEELSKLPKTNDIQEVSDIIENGINTLEIISKIKPVNKKLIENINRREKGKNVMENINNEYNQTVTEYKNALLEHKLCPVCMSKISEDKLEHIEDYI